MAKPFSWRPVRCGPRYCSPACGGGCTWAAYKGAVKAAAALAKRLGPQWKVLVWENLGWHYEVHCKGVQVYPSCGGKRFHCLVGTSDDVSGGLAAWNVKNVITDDPMEAVRLQLKHVRAYVNRLNKTVTAQESAIFGKGDA